MKSFARIIREVDLVSRLIRCILLLLSIQIVLASAGCNQKNNEDVSSMESQFQSIPIVGGGYVTGLFAHPTEENLFYARTDVGGAYRWDNDNSMWVPILDMFGSDKHEYYDVASIALDPNDPNVVFAAVGRGKKYNILRSTDRGNTWTETNPPSDVIILGNAEYRWCGERLAIDPNKGSIVYYGSASAGLWKNTDPTKDKNWIQIPLSQVPLQSGDGNKVGITFVAFDQNGGTDETGATKIIYAGLFGNGETDGIYRSTDAGRTWELVPNSPKNPQRGIVASDGTLYVAHMKGVSKLSRNGSFIDISDGLRRGAYCGICVDPNDPKHVIVAQQNMNSHNNLYRSTDGGETWTKITCIRGTSPEWWPEWFWFARTSSIMMNPFNTKQIWYCDWYGIWRTEDVTAEGGAVFNAYNKNHEELCIATVCSPTSGETRLFSGIHDVTGFRHVSLTEIPEKTLITDSEFNEITSYAVFELDSNIVYRVNQSHEKLTGAGYKSTDNGKTWQRFSPSLPKDYIGGKIAVSSEDPNILVWTPVNKKAWYSHDGGSTWAPCDGISINVVTTVWDAARVQLAANRKGRTIFYIFRSEIGFYRSMDNGKTFQHIKNGLPTAYANCFSVKAVPNQDGGVWVNIENEGLFKSDDAGETFTKLENVKAAQAFAFGKAKPGSKYPATVYLFGRLNTDTQPENRLYMSDDMGKTWRRINDDNHKAGKLVCMDGDGQVYGKVFFGTSGRSIYYYGPGE